MKILVGVIPYYEDGKYTLNDNYIKRLVPECMPVIIPYEKVEIDFLDGVVLSGGGDFSGEILNEKLHPKAKDINIKRDLFEINLIKRVIDNNIPLLGICRGMQGINIALGGKICQDIPNHMQILPKEETSHLVKINKNSLLYKIYGSEEIKVNSFHHQCVSDLGKGLVKSGESTDGVTEAIEYNNLFTLGVQWHPEALDNTIFNYFLDKCREHRRNING